MCQCERFNVVGQIKKLAINYVLENSNMQKIGIMKWIMGISGGTLRIVGIT